MHRRLSPLEILQCLEASGNASELGSTHGANSGSVLVNYTSCGLPPDHVGSTIPIAIKRRAVMEGMKKYSPPRHSTNVLSLLMI